MQIGIAGLPGAGKTTVFNALARAHARTGGFTSAQSEPNRAVVKVPDPRVDKLAEIFKPRSIKHAEVQFVDVAGLAKGAGMESAAGILGHLRAVDALLVVVAAFEPGTSAAKVAGDLANLEGEFILADLDVVERRVERLDREVRMVKGTDVERQTKARELDLLKRVKAALDQEIPVRAMELEREEQALLRGYALLSAKPMLAILNVGDDLATGERMRAELQARPRPYAPEWLTIAGRLEMELAELDAAEAQEFMEAMGLSELSSGRVIEASYRLLDLISFLTAGED